MSKLPFNVWLLTLILSFSMSASAMMVIVGGILGSQLAPSPQFSTLPVALMILGVAIGVIPVTKTMGKIGRKPVFIGVAILSSSSALLAAYSAQITNFYIFFSEKGLIKTDIPEIKNVLLKGLQKSAKRKEIHQ